jgi:hypothetical protein
LNFNQCTRPISATAISGIFFDSIIVNLRSMTTEKKEWLIGLLVMIVSAVLAVLLAYFGIVKLKMP